MAENSGLREHHGTSNTESIELRVLLLLVSLCLPAFAADPLPSWNEGAAKAAIVDFVDKVTKPGSPDFVAPEKRIAAFDNDGTLWIEQPMYVQLAFLLDRVAALAPEHPEVEGHPAVQGGAGARSEGARWVRSARSRRAERGHERRHDDGGV